MGVRDHSSSIQFRLTNSFCVCICAFSTFLREPETKETWRAVDEATAERFKQSEFGEWDYGIGELVKSCSRMIRVGILPARASEPN